MSPTPSGPSARPWPAAAPLVVLSLLAACGDDDPAGPPATDEPSPASFTGSWSGTTSQGRVFRLEVSAGRVASVTVGYEIRGSRCLLQGETTFSAAATISDGRFDALAGGGDPSIGMQGQFDSSTSASGTVDFRSTQCGGNASANWTASKFDPSSVAMITGTWSGTYSTSIITSQVPITLTLQQSGSTFSGTFAAANGASGTFNGTVSGSSVTFTMTNTLANCPGSFSGMATVTGSQMSASFQGSDCLGSHQNGRAELTRQP